MKKLFVIRKYIFACSAQDALRNEKKIKPDDCWIDEDWKKENMQSSKKDIGFNDK